MLTDVAMSTPLEEERPTKEVANGGEESPRGGGGALVDPAWGDDGPEKTGTSAPSASGSAGDGPGSAPEHAPDGNDDDDDEHSPVDGARVGPATEEEERLLGWKRSSDQKSLAEAHSTVPFPALDAPWWRKLASFTGVGLLVGVGYMDPGNWATDVAGGAYYAFDLLCVVLMANLMAIYLQFLCIKLGVATGRDLAMACRDAFYPRATLVMWVLMELAIAATDLAEILGAAIALNLLTGLPIPAGVVITGLDVFFILFLQNNRIRILEGLVAVLTLTILVCLAYVAGLAKPDAGVVMRGYLPTASLFTDSKKLFVAIGILGATVMPHNLFLHSSLVQTRNYPRTTLGKRVAVKFATIDSTLFLSLAMVVNSLILIVAASAFYGREDVGEDVDITTAYQLLSPAVGAQAASILFGVSLLFSGQQASLTGTLAGQIVMEGMINIRLAPWKRRLLTRLIAMTPAVVVTSLFADSAGKLLLISQVILSIALSFVLPPLVFFTSDPTKMGKSFVNSRPTVVVGVLITLGIIALNVVILTTPSTWEL